MKFIIEQSDEHLTPVAGLALVGEIIEHTALKLRLNKTRIPGVSSPDISHGDVITSYIGLLCQGRSDFDHIELYRDDPFFAAALGIQDVPSSPTLRQRLDMIARSVPYQEIILEETARFLKKLKAPVTPVTLGSGEQKRQYVPLDIDVTPFDNSNSKKEGVSRTYKGYDGYAPIFAYLGMEGYCVNTELRAGKQHCQKGTPEFLRQALTFARAITSLPLLVRMDGGNDSQDNLQVCLDPEIKADFIIKRNLRKETPEAWLAVAKENGNATVEREGKTVYQGHQMVKIEGADTPVRLVYKVTERTILRSGQLLLVPEIEVETYWTTLPDPVEDIIALYHDHGTSEQFHSEIKNDLDLERLPSGKFATNDLVLHLGIFAYNILRLLGQFSLPLKEVPLRNKKAQRRRLRTVIQNLITIASRLVHHARQVKLRFGRHSPWYPAFRYLYKALA